MKKQILLAIFFFVTLAACTKNAADVTPPVTPEQKTDNGKLYAVNINLGKFETNYVGSGGKIVNAKDYLKSLYYCLYDSIGNLKKRMGWGLYIYPGLSIPESITDSLPLGNYTMVLMGASADTLYLQGVSQLTTLKFSATPHATSEIFFKKIPLSITEKDTSLNNVQLERVTGLLDVNLTDSNMPAGISFISVKVENAPVYFNVNAVSVTGFDSSILNSQAVIPVNISGSFLGSSNKLKVSIKAFAFGGQILSEKIIENVYVYPNKKTILTGKLFSPSQSVSGNVVVDDSYSDVINQTF